MSEDEKFQEELRYNRKGRLIVPTPGERLPGIISVIFAFLIPVLVIAKGDGVSQNTCYLEHLSQVLFLIKSGISKDKLCFAQSMFLTLLTIRFLLIVFCLKHDVKYYITLYGKHKFVSTILFKQSIALLLIGLTAILVAFVNDHNISKLFLLLFFLSGISLGRLLAI